MVSKSPSAAERIGQACDEPAGGPARTFNENAALTRVLQQVCDRLTRVEAQLAEDRAERRSTQREVQRSIAGIARRQLGLGSLRDLEVLVPGAKRLFGEQAFAAAELAVRSINAPKEEALRVAIGRYRDRDGGVRALGHLLKDATDVVVDGLRLECVQGRTREGRLYVIRVTPEGGFAPP